MDLVQYLNDSKIYNRTIINVKKANIVLFIEFDKKSNKRNLNNCDKIDYVAMLLSRRHRTDTETQKKIILDYFKNKQDEHNENKNECDYNQQ